MDHDLARLATQNPTRYSGFPHIWVRFTFVILLVNGFGLGSDKVHYSFDLAC